MACSFSAACIFQPALNFNASYVSGASGFSSRALGLSPVALWGGKLKIDEPVVARRRRQQQCRRAGASFNTETASTSSSASSEPATQSGPPIIQLQFIEPGSRYEPQTFSAVSGEKNLRKFMLENKLELYELYGKMMNCGGGGSCGTCVVEILEGQELLSEKTDAEYKYLKKKPESWRLTCQTIVGDKVNSGKVVVQQLPQKKK